MKAFFKVIAEFFQNMDGSGSSRRLVGIGLAVCGIMGIFLGKDAVACLGLVTGGVTLLGLTTADDHTIKTEIQAQKKTLGLPDNGG